MQLTVQRVPFKRIDHRNQPVLKVNVDQLLFVCFLNFGFPHIFGHLKKRSSKPVFLLGFRGTGDVVHSSLQLGHDNLVLGHHIN